MFKLLKWDILNYVKKYYELYIMWAVVFVITAVIPGSIPYLSAAVDGIAVIVGMFFFIYSIVIPAVETVNWLRKDSYQLELSLPVEPWKMLLSKLSVSTGIVVIGTILSILLWSLIFPSKTIVLSQAIINFLTYMIGILVLLIITIFSYISVKSIGFTRNRPDITAVFNFSLICLLLVSFVYVFFIATGVWHIDSAHFSAYKGGGFHISHNQNLKWLQTSFLILYPLVISVLGFWGSCSLFKRRFERY